MKCCDQSWNFTNFAPELYQICITTKKLSSHLESQHFTAKRHKCKIRKREAHGKVMDKYLVKSVGTLLQLIFRLVDKVSGIWGHKVPIPNNTSHHLGFVCKLYMGIFTQGLLCSDMNCGYGLGWRVAFPNEYSAETGLAWYVLQSGYRLDVVVNSKNAYSTGAGFGGDTCYKGGKYH